jgi:hypothetical protein
MPANTKGDIEAGRYEIYLEKQRFEPYNQTQRGMLQAQAKAARVLLQYGLLSFENLSCVLKSYDVGLCTRTTSKASIFVQVRILHKNQCGYC